jgi:hypothetical protein
MAYTPKKSFFDLPTEIRNEIYTLVVYHRKTGGIISPLGGKRHPEINIALLDGRRYPVRHRRRYYAENSMAPAEREELDRFKGTTNNKSGHFCSHKCLRPPQGVSQACRQMREEVLGVFYSVNSFHFEMSNFEVTDISGLSVPSWSPVKWWRAIQDTNLRRITTLSLVCHPSNKDMKGVHLMFRYRWVGRQAEVSVERLEPLAYEKARIANSEHLNKPPNRHPLDMTRFESYRHHKWTQSGDFEAVIEPFLKTMQESGLHVRALEEMVLALEPWNAEYLQDHMSVEDELVVGNVKEGRGERALKWDFLS